MEDVEPVDPLPYTPEEVEQAVGPEWHRTLESAYAWMVLARTFDARMQALQRQGRIGFYGAATGQEAVNVATGLVVAPEDWVFPGLREQLVALVRGFSLEQYAHSIFANDRDTARGRQMPCHPTAREVRYVSMSSVIGTQISQAVGLGFAVHHRNSREVVLAYFGDGASSSNDFHAGLNFAAVFHLPIVFVCANNQWAISVPVAHQTASATIAAKAPAYGVPGERIDGTDFVAVYRALRKALESARQGGGPSMLEMVTFRMTPHSTSDDPSRYQEVDWAQRAKQRDPVRRLELWMRERGILSDALAGTLQGRAEEQVRTAVASAELAPPPSPGSLTEDVYSSSRSGRRPSAT
jgi:pyruvate dehydrogenase E1 component alpha subunit